MSLNFFQNIFKRKYHKHWWESVQGVKFFPSFFKLDTLDFRCFDWLFLRFNQSKQRKSSVSNLKKEGKNLTPCIFTVCVFLVRIESQVYGRIVYNLGRTLPNHDLLFARNITHTVKVLFNLCILANITNRFLQSTWIWFDVFYMPPSFYLSFS